MQLLGNYHDGMAHLVMMVMVVDSGGGSTDLIPQDSGDGRDGRDVVLVADAVGQEPVADLPGEDARIFALQLFNVTDHLAVTPIN